MNCRRHPLPNRLAALLGTLYLFLSACSETTFGSKSDKDPQSAPEAAPLTFSAPCVAPAAPTPASATAQATARGPWTATFTGELCPTPSSAALHVALLVDISYSMRQVDLPLEGNCGRLTAGKALVASLREQAQAQGQAVETIRLSLVHFAETATNVKRDVTLADADELTTMDLLCEIESETNGFTSYRAAFAEIPALENAADLARLVYLVTDGVPTIGGDAPAGFLDDAAESQRRLAAHAKAGAETWATASVGADGRPWTLNALFLGNKLDYSTYDFDPETYLSELTGDATRVALVDADALADEIVTMPLGVPAVDPASVTAALLQGTSSTPLTVTSVERRHPGTAWTVTLAPFTIDAAIDTAENTPFQVQLAGVDRAGAAVQSLTDIRVEPPSDSR